MAHNGGSFGGNENGRVGPKCPMCHKRQGTHQKLFTSGGREYEAKDMPSYDGPLICESCSVAKEEKERKRMQGGVVDRKLERRNPNRPSNALLQARRFPGLDF